MPKSITPQQRRQTAVLDGASAASCAQALADHLMDNPVPDADEVKRLVRAIEKATCRVRRNIDQIVDEAGAIPAAPASQRVVIVGPNLRDQSKGQFHVHAEGCADLKRDRNVKDEDQSYVITASTLNEIGDDIYADHVDEGSMDPGEGYHDCHFAPCVNLPRA